MFIKKRAARGGRPVTTRISLNYSFRSELLPLGGLVPLRRPDSTSLSELSTPKSLPAGRRGEKNLAGLGRLTVSAAPLAHFGLFTEIAAPTPP